MSIEEKAKAYDEALERARKVYQDIKPENMAVKTMLEEAFPSLRESEDERIRKALINILNEYKTLLVNEGISSEQAIAYLEKQKEMPMPNSTELIEMWHNEKKMLEEKDFRGDTWRIAYNAFLDGFAQGMMVKQKEQKLADEQFPPLEGLDAIKAEYYDKGFKNGFDEGVDSVKPVEWSEEDEAMRNNILSILSCFVGTVECESNTSSYPLYQREMDWLKSLRPSWKPSEEQMEALQHAINACESEWAYQDDELRSLLNDLKKL